MFKQTFPLAILAGLCISIGCIVNLRVGGVAGAVLFAFGLTTVVYYKLKLYTGTAGFIRAKGEWSMLVTVLLGNIVGCLLTALVACYAQPDIIEPASKILEGRLAKGPLACGLLAACPSSSSVALPTPLPMPSTSWPVPPNSCSARRYSSSTSLKYLATSLAVTSTVG